MTEETPLDTGEVVPDAPAVEMNTVPTVPLTGRAPLAAAPLPPGNEAPIMAARTNENLPSAPAGFGVPAPGPIPVSTPVDPEREKALTEQLMPILRDGLADLFQVSADVVREGAAYYAPLIARQVVLQTSSDPQIATRAAGHKRHLEGQFLMRAAEHGIPLQQRNELRAMTVVNTVLAAGVKIATGAKVG
jgi:hypothetical protein